VVGSRKGQRWETTVGYGGHGEAGGGVTNHLLINDLDDVIRTSRFARRFMTLIASSWSLTFGSSDVTNAINCLSRKWKVITPSWYLHLWSCEHGWRYQGRLLNVRWNLNTHPILHPRRHLRRSSFSLLISITKWNICFHSTINKGFTTRLRLAIIHIVLSLKCVTTGNFTS
jgi:hypothetical protein